MNLLNINIEILNDEKSYCIPRKWLENNLSHYYLIPLPLCFKNYSW